MDMNDRQLRFIVDGLGGKVNGTPREDGFDITVASEIMAIFCLATSIYGLERAALQDRRAPTPTTASPSRPGSSGAAGAMTALLKDALKPESGADAGEQPGHHPRRPLCQYRPRLQQRAWPRKLSLSLADYVITEAGFGADLGAEKFLDIKCRYAGIAPSACVVVATVRALKNHGGVAKADLNQPRTSKRCKAGPAEPGAATWTT